ncbi:hypothetical protein FRB99_004000 [Tulasnella sp. 403]|nr:hypothetical protein FRB99_004000 [Tulasnella sp. 403]
MDDEAADIQLLDQYLHKTSQISTRMTSILKKFDDRLKHLEKSILPLHTSTHALTRISDSNTLQSIDKVASNQQDTAAEEAVILRGPRSNDPGPYIDALERLNATLAFRGDRFNQDTTQLVETGAKKLSQMYTKLVAEACSGSPIDPISHLPSPPNPFPTIPPQILKSLQPLVSALRRLPLPATHPSHPVAPQIYNTLKEAQRGYGEMRGTWAKKSLEQDYRQLLGQIETASSANGLDLARDVGQWVEALLALAQAEHETLERVALLPSSIQSTFAAASAPLVTMFSSLLSTIQATIKKSLLTHVWFAFGLWGILGNLQPVWDDVMRQRTGRKENELSEAVHALRGVCLRSFPEFIMDIKQAGIPPPPNAKQIELGTAVADVTKMTVAFLNQIPDLQGTISAALRTLGDGNWKMGDGPSVGKMASAESEVDDHTLLEHFCHDVVVTLTTSLTSLSKIQRRASLSSIFLLNNVSHLRTKLILEPTTPIDEFISSNTQNHLNAQYRVAKAAYFEANFTVLLSSLNEDKKAGKSGTKEKFATFFDTLEEIAERHRFARVLGDDANGRDGLADDVVRLVIPALQRFMQKHKDKEFSKNPQKYIKATPEEVETQIRNFYR